MRQHQQQLDEASRHNLADEDLRAQQIRTMGLSRQDALAESERQHKAAETDRTARTVESRVALRPIGSQVSPEERQSERGLVPEGAYSWAPPTLGATSHGPTP